MPVLLKPRVERAVAAGRAEASSAMAPLSAANSELPAGEEEVWGSGCGEEGVIGSSKVSWDQLDVG